MPRRYRCILPGVACHVTQRGVDRRETFSAGDRETYVTLIRQNLQDAGVRLLAWCLMTNHIHLIAMPEREDSLAVLLRRVHGRYAQYYNARHGRTGHLWQNRHFACSLAAGHLWAALAYVEMNPVRARLVERPLTRVLSAVALSRPEVRLSVIRSRRCCTSVWQVSETDGAARASRSAGQSAAGFSR